MSFGKKTSVPLPRYSNGLRENAAAEPESGSPLLRQLSGFGVKIAVCVVAAVILAVIVNRLAGPTAVVPRYLGLSPAHDAAEAVFAAAGDDAKELAAKCPIPRFEPWMARRDPRALFLPGGREAVEKAAKVQLAVLEGAYVSDVGEHVACVITYKSERYCQSSQRSALVAYVHTYLGMREKSRELIRQAMNFSEAQLDGYIRFTEKKLDQHTGRQTAEQMIAMKGFGELSALNPQFQAALKFLIEDGYLSVGDVSVFLGMVTPAPLKTIFASTHVRTRECRTQ